MGLTMVSVYQIGLMLALAVACWAPPWSSRGAMLAAAAVVLGTQATIIIGACAAGGQENQIAFGIELLDVRSSFRAAGLWVP